MLRGMRAVTHPAQPPLRAPPAFGEPLPPGWGVLMGQDCAKGRDSSSFTFCSTIGNKNADAPFLPPGPDCRSSHRPSCQPHARPARAPRLEQRGLIHHTLPHFYPRPILPAHPSPYHQRHHPRGSQAILQHQLIPSGPRHPLRGAIQ